MSNTQPESTDIDLDKFNHPLADSPELQPLDQFNRTLAANVHPADWQNPTPSGRYNLVVIGAGTAGLVTAAGAAGLGGKVALVERNLMGGDCLNIGCVPSKSILHSARVAAVVRDAGHYGIVVENYHIDFAAIMRRMRKIRSEISSHDSAKRFADLGVDVFIGNGKFVGDDRVEVTADDGRVTTLKFKRAVIATGARAAKLPIPGIDEIDALTNETVFSLTELPPRLTVIGGGPIGCEMAQSFARFGSVVTQIEHGDRILQREDADAAKIIQQQMSRDGVNFLLNAEAVRFEQRGGEKVTIYKHDGQQREIVGDEVLIGIGRTPNVHDMGLETIGVEFDDRGGVTVDDRMKTTCDRIYAAGDVASRYKFTHAADFQARMVIGNTLFHKRDRASDLVLPWCTYTSPELAHVGITPEQAEESEIEIDTYTQELSGVDRAILEGRTDGFARVHVRAGTEKILGATIVAENAGDLIAELTLAMNHGIGLSKIGSSIHPYPTTGDVVRKLGDQYNKTRLTPTVAKLFQKWLKLSR